MVPGNFVPGTAYLYEMIRTTLRNALLVHPLAAVVALSTLIAGCTIQRSADISHPAVAYENGRWFDGTSFELRTMYVAGGRFVPQPRHITTVVDLAGGYVVPPFAEAHNHNVEPSPRINDVLRAYVDAGVFYVQNPDSVPRARTELADRVNRPGAIDVTFAHVGITGPGGHPAQFASRNRERGIWSPDDADGFVMTIADQADLDRAWPLVLQTNSDFVKVYLLYSEEYHTRLSDESTLYWRGLDPGLLPEVIRRARAAGLRVAAHVETAADFRTAVEAGVDQIAHMPGFRGDAATTLDHVSRYEIAEADARLAGERKIVVITTLSGLARHADAEGDATLREAVDRLFRRNLEILRRHGVPIAIGSDTYSDTSVAEAMYLHEIGVFTPAELLRIWTEMTPQAIFPERRIGRLEPGYEASFLSLAGDPLENFDRVTQIRLRVKQGKTIGGERIATAPK